MVPQAEIHSSTGEKRPELGSEVGGTGGNCKEPGVAIEGERLVDGGIWRDLETLPRRHKEPLKSCNERRGLSDLLCGRSRAG